MCNLVIKLEVSYQFRMFIPWPWARAQQPQQHQEAAAPTSEEENAEAIQQQQHQHIRPQQQQHQHQTDSRTGVHHGHQLLASSSHAAADMISADQQHQQSLEGAWRHHSAGLVGSLPQQQSLAEDWYHVPAPSAADDYYAPNHSSLSPQLAQERLEASPQSQQSHALQSFRPDHLCGFAASALLSQAPPSSSSDPAATHLWGRNRGHVADSPVTGGQTQASPVFARMGPATPAGTTFQGTRTRQVHVAEEEQSQGCSQDAIAEQPQERRMLRRSFMPAALMRRIIGTPRRNRENGGLARVGSNNVGKMSAGTDLADASAMPATN